jgi:hypothetical protein
MKIFVLTEEHWAADGFKQSRLGLYVSRALAEDAAQRVFSEATSCVADPENYSYLVEEETLIKKTSADLIAEAGRAWRRWPAMAEGFAAV